MNEHLENDPTRERAAPPHVIDLADSCVRFVAARYSASLDYSPDTLSLLDQWVRDARQEHIDRSEVTRIVEVVGGAYLGEVVRRSFGGNWRTAPDESAWRLLLSSVYCAFNPLGVVREAILLEPSDGWHAYMELEPSDRDAIATRLDALPQVDDDDYYLPSTRFDVIELVVDALSTAQRTRGMGDVVFGPEDYSF